MDWSGFSVLSFQPGTCGARFGSDVNVQCRLYSRPHWVTFFNVFWYWHLLTRTDVAQCRIWLCSALAARRVSDMDSGYRTVTLEDRPLKSDYGTATLADHTVDVGYRTAMLADRVSVTGNSLYRRGASALQWLK